MKEARHGAAVGMRGILKEGDLDVGFAKPRSGMRGGQEKRGKLCYQTLSNTASKAAWLKCGEHVKLHPLMLFSGPAAWFSSVGLFF